MIDSKFYLNFMQHIKQQQICYLLTGKIFVLIVLHTPLNHALSLRPSHYFFLTRFWLFSFSSPSPPQCQYCLLLQVFVHVHTCAVIQSPFLSLSPALLIFHLSPSRPPQEEDGSFNTAHVPRTLPPPLRQHPLCLSEWCIAKYPSLTFLTLGLLRSPSHLSLMPSYCLLSIIFPLHSGPVPGTCTCIQRQTKGADGPQVSYCVSSS